jgi:purine-binding chemotaxis protein CheW
MYNIKMDAEPIRDETHTSSDLFTQEQKEEAIELFLFELDNELYAVSVEDVDQVIKIPPVTSVPNAPESILGIFHLRGKVIVVIDILKRMRIKRLSSFVPLYLFVSHKQNNYFAVVVDRVFSVIKVPTSEIVPLTPIIASKINAEYVHGMFMHREPLKIRKHPDNFLIEPKKTGEVALPEETPARPALWLNIQLLLDQQDILQMQKNV